MADDAIDVTAPELPAGQHCVSGSATACLSTSGEMTSEVVLERAEAIDADGRVIAELGR